MATCETEFDKQIEISTNKTYVYPLLRDVHCALAPPTPQGKTYYTRGHLNYFHYGCDGQQDEGWGCGYRTLQSVASWILNKRCDGDGSEANLSNVPSIKEIQKILVSIGDKSPWFVGSHEWIGTLETLYVIDVLFSVPCKILHVQVGESIVDKIHQYFEEYAGFIMMGGMTDTASKGICGIHLSGDGVYLLVMDPHYSGIPQSTQELTEARYIRWTHIAEFDNAFYNLCMPLLK